MGFERTREFLLKLPRVAETLQWEALVFWAGDKAVGGRMFAMLHPEPEAQVIAFAAPPERFHDLLETEGIRPAPYLARAHWVAVESWDAIPESELHDHLRNALERVYNRLTRKTQRVLEGTDREYRTAVREARAAAKAAVKTKR